MNQTHMLDAKKNKMQIESKVTYEMIPHLSKCHLSQLSQANQFHSKLILHSCS